MRSYVDDMLDIFSSLGERDAFIDEGERLSFRRLRIAVLEMANALHASGIHRGCCVGMLTGNRPYSIVVQLSVHLLGCRFAVIKTGGPVEELAEFAKRADVTALIIDPEEEREAENAFRIAESLGSACMLYSLGPLAECDDLLRIAAEMPSEKPDVAVADEDIKTLYYTGGTTGRPKLVLHGHAYYHYLLRLAAYQRQANPQEERFLVSTPLTHGSGLASALMTLAKGATLVLLRRFDAGDALRAIERYRVNGTFLFPPLLYEMLDHPRLPDADCSSLRGIGWGGGPMLPSRLLQAIERFGPIIYAVYGLVECPMVSVASAEDYDPQRPDSLHNCGRPIPGLRVRIADEDNQELSSGQIGEICVRGPLVMLGYWQDAEFTSRALHDGWLRTGDLGYIDDNGLLHLVDRAKDVIITGRNATNIYSVLVEEALDAHPAVKQAVVVGVPDETFGERVHACVVVHTEVEEEELKSFVKGKLDELYAPDTIEFASRIPVTAMGKTDKVSIRRRVTQVQETN